MIYKSYGYDITIIFFPGHKLCQIDNRSLLVV